LQGGSVSRLQARLIWRNEHWTVRDLGSRNGTYVNGERCVGGNLYPIRVGDRLLLGDKRENWVLTDGRAPRSVLIPLSGDRSPVILENLLVLPSMEHPHVTVFGVGPGRYEFESEEGTRAALDHNQQIIVGGQPYIVHICDGDVGDEITRTDTELTTQACEKNLQLEIAVAPDEESAGATIKYGNVRHVLKPKVHLYLLAHLARMRISQTPSDIVSTNEEMSDAEGDDYGWVDCKALCKDLLINPVHLTQQVCRIRKDFQKISPFAAETVIDRRLRGKMRVGIPAKRLIVNRIR
jgi:pSer/pThr/pTyr-binding forkhead associated (FHA) protein